MTDEKTPENLPGEIAALRAELALARRELTERTREAERAKIEGSAELLRLVTDRLPVRVAYIDREFRFRFMNDAYEREVGLSREKAIGRTIAEATNEATFQAVRANLEQALRGESHVKELSIPYPTGSRIVQVSYVPDLDAAGRANGVVVQALDVTERRQAEEEAREGEARLRAILDASAGGFYAVDAAGRTTLGNAAFLRMLGIGGMDEVQGVKLHDRIHHTRPDGSPYPVGDCPIYRAASAGVPAHVVGESFYRLDDGVPFPVEYWTEPVVVDGENRGAVTTFLDITERRAAEAELKASEAHYRSLFDSLDDGFCTFEMIFDAAGRGRDYRFLDVNAAFEAQTGLSREDVLGGRTIREIIPTHEQKWFDFYGEVARTGLSARTEDRAEGLGRWFETHAFRIGGEESRVVGALFKDVTARRVAEVERERLVGELSIERGRLQALFEISPSAVAVLRGAELRYEFANEMYRALFTGGMSVVGRPLVEVLPEAVEQGFGDLLRNVMATGVPFRHAEMPFEMRPVGGETARTVYVDFVYQPIREADGTVSGVFAHIVDVTDQVVARKAIAEREELFRTVFEQAPDDAILVMDAFRTVTAWNPAAERITLWSAAEAIGRSGDLIFTAEDREKGVPAEEGLTAAREGKAEDERWHLRKDGSRFWGSGTMNSLHDAEGNVRGFLKVFRDATERHEETRALAFLRRLTDALIDLRDPDAIVRESERTLGEHLDVNRVLYGEFAEDEETFDVRFDWAQGVASLVGTHRLGTFGRRIERNLRAGRTDVIRDREAEFTADDGLLALRGGETAAAITVPIHKEGRMIGVFAVNAASPRDWSQAEIDLVQQVGDRMAAEVERARAEAALREANGLVQAVLSAAEVGVWNYDPASGSIGGDPNLAAIFGLPVDVAREAAAETFIARIHPDDQPLVAERFGRAARDGTPYEIEYRVVGGSMGERWVVARGFAEKDDEGRVVRMPGVVLDITGQVRARLQLAALNDELEARVEDRTAQLQAAVKEAEGFNYSIAHDLRSPLRAMASTSSILLEDLGPELDGEHRDLLVRQKENAVRLGRLIDELLRLSRLARAEVVRTRVDVTAEARAEFEEMDRQGRTNGCRLEVQEGMTAQADLGLLRTVLHNLVGNAFKFSPNGGTVRVAQEGATFSVVDEGVGFDMAFAPKIFLPFERLVPETQFEGTGIGLANVERIVRRHGGRVWVESAPGKGATFRFTLVPE